MTDTEKKIIVINEILIPSLRLLYETDFFNIRNGVSERNICARFAHHIENRMKEYDKRNNDRLFQCYYADVEYNRMNNGNTKHYEDSERRPREMVSDLVIHNRGPRQNYLAVEMKRKGNYQKRKNDRERLNSIVSMPAESNLDDCVYGTLIGVFIIYSVDEIKVELYEANKEPEEIDFVCQHDGKRFISLDKTYDTWNNQSHLRI